MTSSELETILKQAPKPEPPEHLLAVLERQIHLPPVQSPSFWERWRKILIPLTALAGSAAIAIAFSLCSSGTPKTLTPSTGFKSFHVVIKHREGPGIAVIRDAHAPTNSWPNYITSDHPKNPMVASEYWFEENPSNPNDKSMRRISLTEDVFRTGNKLLKIDRKTGGRTFTLINNKFNFGGYAFDIAAITNLAKLNEVSSKNMPGVPPDQEKSLWFGETRVAEHGDHMIARVWLNRTNNLPVRFQIWSTDFPEIAPEVLMQEAEFSDFNVQFPARTFAFEVTDKDLVSLGINKKQLDSLSDKAMSIRFTGDKGLEVVGTITDNSGTRKIRGILPMTLIHEQNGRMDFELRAVNGQQCYIGVEANGSSTGCGAKAIRGWFTPEGQSGITSKP